MYTPETLRRLSDEIESIPAQNDYGTLDEANKARSHADAWQARETELIEALDGLLAHLWDGRKRDVKKDYSLMVAEVAARNAIKKADGGLLSDGHRAGHG